MMLTVTEEYMEVEDPIKQEDDMISMGGQLIEGDMRMEVTLGEGMQIEVEDLLMMDNPLMMENPLMMVDPLMMEDPLIMEDPQAMEGPLMMEDPQEMEGIPDTLEDEDPLVPQDLLDQ